MWNSTKTVRSGVWAAGVLAVVAGAAWGDVIRVPEDQPTIQGALAAAQNGDEIVVAPGVYRERVNTLGKAVTLRSSGGAGVTVIEGDGAGRVLTIGTGEGRATLVEGFTLRNGRGGVLIDRASPTLRGLVITGNAVALAGVSLASAGGGVLVVEGAPRLENLRVHANNAGVGGGVALSHSRAELVNLEATSNTARRGGGVWVSGGEVAVEGALLARNRADTGGGAYLAGGRTLVEGSTFFENGAYELRTDPMGQPTLVFYTVEGGGLYSINDAGVVRAARFIANNASFGGGVAVAGTPAMSPDRSITLVNTLVASNRGGFSGLYINDAAPRVVNATIVNNGTPITGYGVYHTWVGAPTLVNTIVAGNTLPGVEGIDVISRDSTNLTASFTLVPGPLFPTFTRGAGFVEASFASVRFADPAGADNVLGTLDDDYRLLAGSRAIDAGDSSAVPPGVVTDLGGSPRISGAGVDIGAFEFQSSAGRCVPDRDGDGEVTFADVLAFVASYNAGVGGTLPPGADLNADQELTFDDIQMFVAMYSAGC